MSTAFNLPWTREEIDTVETVFGEILPRPEWTAETVFGPVAIRKVRGGWSGRITIDGATAERIFPTQKTLAAAKLYAEAAVNDLFFDAQAKG